ncbi:MAG TPA: LLM class F420-dependent oxidoreductase [Capillimicrobium sp.]|nr:LLM class F420-dependent oxidoreductase [Capillimicrobium sp.]
MEFGVSYFATHDAMGPGPLARLLEERGQESVWFSEHSHIPVSRRTPHPAGIELPRKYLHTYDLFVAMTVAAAATTRLRIGSGVCLVPQRDPITTAKEVASVDHLSGGRVEFGVGAGWNREEMEDHGTDPRTRVALMQERLEAMKAIWTQAEASYHGRFVDFEPMWQWPKPVQRPHPPVLVGGDGPLVRACMLAVADAWIPLYRPGVIEHATEVLAQADRPIELQLMGVPPDPAVLEQAERAGVRRAIAWLPCAGRGPIEKALDEWENAIVEFTGG